MIWREFFQQILHHFPKTINTSFKSKANINRIGVTNAADRGLDMWANFGPAIQIKHLSLNEKCLFAADMEGNS